MKVFIFFALFATLFAARRAESVEVEGFDTNADFGTYEETDLNPDTGLKLMTAHQTASGAKCPQKQVRLLFGCGCHMTKLGEMTLNGSFLRGKRLRELVRRCSSNAGKTPSTIRSSCKPFMRKGKLTCSVVKNALRRLSVRCFGTKIKKVIIFKKSKRVFC